MLADAKPLRHIWVELTNRCNLTCTHCYAGSSPNVDVSNELLPSEVFDLLSDARALDCSSVQFIGGEPMLNHSLPDFIQFADYLGFSDIEIFSNLVSLPKRAIDAIVRTKSRVATSFYSSNPLTHNAITGLAESWDKTVANLRLLLERGVDLRAGFIELEQNEGHFEDARAFLNALGIENVGFDQQRPVGRAAETEALDVSGLCGNCTAGNLCILPEGSVSLCIMSRSHVIGDLRKGTLESLFKTGEIATARERLEQAWSNLPASDLDTVACGPACGPNCEPQCNPRCSPNCSPCFPYGKCNPQLFGR